MVPMVARCAQGKLQRQLQDAGKGASETKKNVKLYILTKTGSEIFGPI